MQPTTYIENSCQIKGGPVSPEMYSKFLDHFISVCTDVIIVDFTRKTCFLAKRISKPMSGWWIMGGRMFAGENENEAIRRNFKRETSLDVEAKRFVFARMCRTLWKDRQQEPKDRGCDNLAYTFYVELTKEEREQVAENLDPKEYDPSFGLQEFDFARLTKENVHQEILDLYLQIFSK